MREIVVTSLLIFILVLLFMYFWQRQLIYFPSREKPQRAIYHASDMRVVMLKTADGLDLHSWYKPAGKGRPTLLYLHGNAGHIGYRMPFVRQLMDVGFGVFLLEYRGYGGNGGSPSERGFYKDADAAVRYLLDEGISSNQLVLYGESLGSGVATQLAARYPVCAVVLQSPPTSLVDLARYHYPWIWIKPWDRFDSLARMKGIHAPLLILHGKRDQVVPFDLGQMLFNASNNPKKMESFEQGDHFNLWNIKGFIGNVIEFVDEHCAFMDN